MKTLLWTLTHENEWAHPDFTFSLVIMLRVKKAQSSKQSMENLMRLFSVKKYIAYVGLYLSNMTESKKSEIKQS